MPQFIGAMLACLGGILGGVAIPHPGWPRTDTSRICRIGCVTIGALLFIGGFTLAINS